MRTTQLMTALLAGILVLGACKKHRSAKDEDIPQPEKNEITYDGKVYTIEKAREWDYKQARYPTHNTFAYFMWNGSAFSQSGGYDLGPNDPPIALFFYLSLPSSSGYMIGDFVYQPLPDDWIANGLPESVKNKQVFTVAVLHFDANNDRKITADEVIPVTGGTIDYNGRSNIGFDLSLANGKTLTGRIKASVIMTSPDN